MKSSIKKLCLAVALYGATSAAWAVPVAAVEWNGNPQNVNTNGDWMMGYEFVATSAVTVTALGAYDSNGDGFVTGSHKVGLWTLGGTLLASMVVDNTDALQGHFRYRSIASIVLIAGNSYVVGADNWGGAGDDWAWRETGGMGLIEAAGIDHIQDKFASGTGFVFPNSSEGTFRDGFFGGNLMIDGAAAAVPEPGTALLLGLGLLGLAVSRRRRA